MNIVQMSLHRVMAEIKSIEEKLTHTSTLSFVQVFAGEPRDDTAKAVRTQFVINAKSALDKTTNMIKNLAALKSARNKANSALTVVINGNTITIDEALAQKAALVHKQLLIDVITRQFAVATVVAQKSNDEIETKIAQQMLTMFSGTRKATEEELLVIRNGVSRSLKPIETSPEGLKTVLENLKTEVSEFEKEIDFVLSEANALNKIEVSLV